MMDSIQSLDMWAYALSADRTQDETSRDLENQEEVNAKSWCRQHSFPLCPAYIMLDKLKLHRDSLGKKARTEKPHKTSGGPVEG